MMLFGGKSNGGGGDEKWRGTIQRALASWDSVVEWGDYIVFLSRLEKAVKSKAGNGNEMPLSAQVSEALARCLDPSLPAGVHQTTVQVYDSVFTSIPRTQLDAEINIWLPGILPLISFAAFNVKPKVIELIENHIVQTPNLRELCRPMLLAILPTMEDATSECYNELVELTQKIRSSLGDDVLMWQCVSMCVISSSECRLGALRYFQHFLPSLETVNEESKPVLSPEPGIFLRAICAGLTDSSIFAQRGFLDVLVKNLPLHSELLETCTASDFSSLLFSACTTILRKDMSLNRRLWAWLLGPDPEVSDSKLSRVEYFNKYGAEKLVAMLLDQIKDRNIAQVCQIVHGLMDRWELASSIVPKLLVPIIKAVEAQPQFFDTSSQLFDGVESTLIWKSALELIRAGDYATVEFIATEYNINEDEMLSVHIPLALAVCVGIRPAPLNLIERLLAVVTPSAFAALSTFDRQEKEKPDFDAISTTFYDKSWFNEDVVSPLTPEQLTMVIADNLVRIYCDTGYSTLLSAFIRLLPSFTARNQLLINKMLESPPQPDLFTCVCSTMSYEEKSLWVRSAVQCYFSELASQQNSQVETVHNLWACHASAGQYLVPSALSQCFAECTSPIEIGRSFSALWVHSADHSNYEELLLKPTQLFLDLLSADNTEEVTVLFIKSAVISTNTVDKLLKVLFSRIRSLDSSRLEYTLKLIRKTVFGIGLKPIKKVFLSQYSKMFFEFFSDMSVNHPNEACYSVGISIIQSSVLDVDKLNVSALTSVLETLMSEVPLSPPLLKFINTVLPHIPFEKRVTFGDEDSLEYQLFTVLNKSIEIVQDEVTANAMAAYLDTFLRIFNESVPQVVNPVTLSLINRLNDLTAQNEQGCELALQLFSCLEKLLLSNFQYLYDNKGGHFMSFQDAAASEPNASRFIGNVISGVFTVENPSEKSAIRDGHILLYEAIEATVQKCCSYWDTLEQVRVNNAAEPYSTSLYMMGRLKTRLRKLAAMLYKYQPIDTIKLCVAYSSSIESAVRFVHMFESSRYKHTVQVLLDNIFAPPQYSFQKDVGARQLYNFLKQYIKTLENDVIEDIWNILMTFCGEIVNKPANRENILFDTLELLIIVSRKVEYLHITNNKRFRKELSDQFIKLFNQSLDTLGFEQLAILVADLPQIVPEPEKQTTLLTKLANNCAENFKAASWNEVESSVTALFAAIVEHSTTPRVWKQAFTDLFFDARFFSLTVAAAKPLVPVVEKWAQLDKDRVLEFMGRVASYGSNSVLFGWSSNSALVDGNLRRLAFMVLACEHLPINTSKLVNQLAIIWNNKGSLPCICVLLQALALKFPQAQIFSFIGFRLQALFTEFFAVVRADQEVVSSEILVAAAKLVDFVLTIEPTAFQMYEWLFICDNPDAIYPRHTPQERCGDIIDKIGSEREVRRLAGTLQLQTAPKKRQPLVPEKATLEDVTAFFCQASITLYEEMYSLGKADTQELTGRVYEDIFNH